MADRFWVDDDVSGLWNAANNWSATSGGAGGAGVPGSSDNVIFDSANVTNCNVDANVNVASFTFDGSNKYTGVLDFVTFTVTISGSFTGNRYHGSILFGSGAWTVGGNLYLRDVAFDGEGTNVTMTGTANLQGSNLQVSAFKLIIASGASVLLGFGGRRDYAALDVTGTLDMADGTMEIFGDIDLQAGGVITGGAGYLVIERTGGTVATFGAGATMSPGQLYFYRQPAGTKTLAQGKYDCDLKIESDSGGGSPFIFQFSAGTTTIDGNLMWERRNGPGSDSLTIDNTANNPDLVLKGDVIPSGSPTWAKGTGDITLSGTGAQAIDFDGESIEDLIVSNTGGTVTFGANFTTDSYNQGPGTNVDGDITITMAGNFACIGTVGHQNTFDGPDLDIGGTATAEWTAVTNSDASAGTEVTATANNTNNDGNVNWNFGVAVAQTMPIISNAGVHNAIFHGLVIQG